VDFLWTAYVKYKHNEVSPAILLCCFGPVKRAVAFAGHIRGSAGYTVLRPSHIPLKKVSIYTRARTQKSWTVSQPVCAFLNPV
jgi:hypothetical protein